MVSRRDKDIITCKECECSWFEQVLVQQYSRFHHVILGQKVTPANEVGFWLLRCVKCKETYEPNIQYSGRDNLRQRYDTFVASMQKKLEDKQDPTKMLPTEPTLGEKV